MPPIREHLRHDLTALFAFIDSVTSGLAARRSVAAYGPAADRFFEFVTKLADSCKDHISSWTIEDDEEFEDRRGELSTLRAAWRDLHFLVKPALDADTLQAPLAVVDGIVRRFQELPGCDQTNFAIFHTSDFNYTEVRTADLSSVVDKFTNVISDPPPFPANLGLIGMPYSQGRTAFATCLVAHEMGHYRYRKLPLEQELKARVDQAVDDFPEPPETKEARRDGLVKKMTVWAEEIFCDLFGVMLIGPCYTFAYVEAYDLAVILDAEGKLSDERLLPRLEFYETYPSHIYRLQRQADLIRESQWWDYVVAPLNGKKPSWSAVLLDRVREITVDTHIKSNEKQGPLIPVLEAMLPHIRTTLGRAFEGVDNDCAVFSQLNPIIQEYLASGIVPSTINIRTGKRPEDTTPALVSPLVLLNSSMDFYLNRVSELMDFIPGENKVLYERRLHWVRRIEEWIAKAIEDQSLAMEVAGVNLGANGN
jgi:hypothetical protein